MRKLDRRQFTQEASLAFLAGVTVTVSACGGGGGGGSNAGDSYDPAGGSTTPTTTLPPAPGSKTGQISANHGHEAVITAAQLQAGGAVQHRHRLDRRPLAHGDAAGAGGAGDPRRQERCGRTRRRPTATCTR